MLSKGGLKKKHTYVLANVWKKRQKKRKRNFVAQTSGNRQTPLNL